MNMHQTTWWLTDTIIEYMLYVVGPSSETWIMPVEHSNHMQLTNALCVVASLNSMYLAHNPSSQITGRRGKKRKKRQKPLNDRKTPEPHIQWDTQNAIILSTL